MLEVQDLWKSYMIGNSRLEILQGAELTVQKSEFVSIAGASGTGKSTFLHLVGGLDKPDRGTVKVAGQSLSDGDEREVAIRRNRQIGFVFQFHHLLPEFTAVENVSLPRRIMNDSPSKAEEEARRRLVEVGLEDRLEHLPTQLSGGERQRVAVARALVNDPHLLLMDEPTGNLDPKTGDRLFEMIRRFQKEKGLTVVIVTHNLDLAERTDRQLVLIDGRLKPVEKSDSPRTEKP